MLDVKLIRENAALVEENLRKRHDPEMIKMLHEFIKLDKQRRETIQEVEKLKQKRNIITKEIAELKAKKKKADAKLKEVKGIPDKIKKMDAKLETLNKKSTLILMTIPNMLHESVPVGKDDNDNVEIRRWGKPPQFDFEPKSHLEILEALGMIDGASAAKTSGSGFFFLKDKLVILDIALQRFAIDFLRSKGFLLVEPPFFVNKRTYEAMIGNPTDFAEASYKIEKEDFYLIPTAEYPLGGMFIDKVFSKNELPAKLVGVSSCFRREVGTHGKYSKGLFRIHQFNKIEQFVFCLPEDSWKLLEDIQKNSEELYQKLGLHYRVVNVCTGDMGTKAAKKYDIEAWMADGKFREVGSNSNCTDYQARRLGVKYREKEGLPPAGFVHTLNNTAIATSRTMIAILEQLQDNDGTVDIPKALWPYTGFKRLEK
jgi:seryl-tRNA synthetase